MGSSAEGSDDVRVRASAMQLRTAAVPAGTRWQAPSSLEEDSAPPGFAGLLRPAFPGPALLQDDAAAAQAALLPPLHFEVPPMEDLEVRQHPGSPRAALC